MENKKVLLGMSGGVDSSVSALLLKQNGYDPIGMTLELFAGSSCCNISTYIDAKNVCNSIGIPHITDDCKTLFKKCVIQDFIDCYSNCKTPNPCIECNKYMKFGYMWEKAKELGCEYIATGHYAKTEYSEKYKQYVLKKSNAGKKDQSYVLYNIPQNIIEKVIFPLGKFENKEQIRKIAEEHGLLTAKKPDSQEICFIPDDDYAGFLMRTGKINSKEGPIVTKSGEVIGTHKGLIHYTIGQRKGLGIAHETPLYVIDLDAKTNRLIVGEEKDIFSKVLYANNLNFTVNLSLENPIRVTAKVRYGAKDALATLYLQNEEKIKLEFDEPQRAITRGQSVVFYIDDVLVGGGKIIS